MCGATLYVRFVPIADIPLLFDHLVGAREHGRWHGEAERLGSFEIDHQRELGRLVASRQRCSGYCFFAPSTYGSPASAR